MNMMMVLHSQACRIILVGPFHTGEQHPCSFMKVVNESIRLNAGRPVRAPGRSHGVGHQVWQLVIQYGAPWFVIS